MYCAELMSVAELIESCRRQLDLAVSAKLDSIAAAARLHPANPLPVYDLALTCRRRGEDEMWRRAVEIALTLPHVSPHQVSRRSQFKLALGDWSGWIDYEARVYDPRSNYRQSDDLRRLRWTKRPWDGQEPIHERTIRVIADGGFGDSLQMLRFIPDVARVAQRVILGVRPEVVSFVQHNFADTAAITFRDLEPTVPYDRYTWMMSLPALVGALPPLPPITAPQPTSDVRGRDRRPKVGLCWAGDPRHPMDRYRSIPFEIIAALVARDDIQWHSLQVGARAADTSAYPNIVRSLDDVCLFSDTADLIAALDGVITVDTAIAHLAGCLGIPTLMLLHWVCDARWSWGVDCTTPWYPSMSVVRQRSPGDWAGVIEAVMAKLDESWMFHQVSS